MLAVYDAKQLEWRAIAHLAKDQIAIKEICDGLDFHKDNQQTFGLPSRLIAKIFLFRNIYCPLWIIDRTAYAYSVDNNFKHVGGRKFWRNAIEKFYDKYQGIYRYHVALKNEAVNTGQIVSATGRVYEIQPRIRGGTLQWPDSDIANWPVQGFSADLMSLIRVSAYRRLKAEREAQRVFFVNTVHDNLVLDLRTDVRHAVEISKIVKGAFQDCGNNYEKIYGPPLLVPMDCDAKLGINYGWTHEIKL